MHIEFGDDEEVDDNNEVDSGDKVTKTEDDTVAPSIKENDGEESDKKIEQIDGDKKEERLSVRDSIKKAFKEAQEKEDATKEEANKEETIKEVKEAKSEPTSNKPPVGWTKKAKEKWGILDSDIKESVLKREKEVSDGFAKYGENDKKYKEIDVVLSPRREAIQRFGATEAEVVNRLFQWMEALSHPQYAAATLKQLADQFKIDLQQFVDPTQMGQQQNNQSVNQLQTDNKEQTISDPVLKQFMDGITSKVDELKQIQETKARQDAEVYVNTWAKDKTHFQALRGTMFRLIQGQVVPLKDGNLDLDKAYDMAIQITPEIKALVDREDAVKKEEVAKQEKLKKENERLKRNEAAKKASVSIKTQAPMGEANNKASSKANGKQPISVRDSIRNAIRELRDE